MNLLKTNLKPIPVWLLIVTLAVVVAGCKTKVFQSNQTKFEDQVVKQDNKPNEKAEIQKEVPRVQILNEIEYNIENLPKNKTSAFGQDILDDVRDLKTESYELAIIEGKVFGEYLDSIPDSKMSLLVNGESRTIGGQTDADEKVKFSRSLQPPYGLMLDDLVSPYDTSDKFLRLKDEDPFSPDGVLYSIVVKDQKVWEGWRYEFYKLFGATQEDLNNGFLVPIAWVSPTTILFNVKSEGWGQSLGMWEFDVLSFTATKLPFPENYVSYPLLSPNGKYILFGIKESEDGDSDASDRWLIYDRMNRKILPFSFRGRVEGWQLDKSTNQKIEDVSKASISSGFSSGGFFRTNHSQCSLVGAPTFKLPWPSGGTNYLVSRTGPVVHGDVCETTQGNKNIGATISDPVSSTGYYCNRLGPVAYSSCSNLNAGPFLFFTGNCPSQTCGHSRPAIDFGAGSVVSNVLAGAMGYAFRDYQASGAGNFVRIFHDLPSGGYCETQYMHLEDNSIPACFPVYDVTLPKTNGYLVQQGEVVGVEGATGGNYSGHIHFELKDAAGISYYPEFSDGANTNFTPKAEHQYASANNQIGCGELYETGSSISTAASFISSSIGGSVNGNDVIKSCLEWTCADEDWYAIRLFDDGQITVQLDDPVNDYHVELFDFSGAWVSSGGSLDIAQACHGNTLQCKLVYIRVYSLQSFNNLDFDYTLNLTWTYNNGCTPNLRLGGGSGTRPGSGNSSSRAMVTASASPTAICPRSTSTITMSGATSYSVVGPGGVSCNPCNTGSVTVTPPSTPGSYDYIISDNINPCGPGSATVTITVHPTPTVNAGPNRTIPFGGSTVLTGSISGAYIVYNWTPGNILNTLSPLVSPTITTVYTLTAFTNMGCQTQDQTVVNVGPASTNPNAHSNVSQFCETIGGSAQLSVTGGQPPYTWSMVNGANYSSLSCTSCSTPTLTSTALGPVRARVTDALGNDSDVTINVYPTPSVNLPYANGQNTYNPTTVVSGTQFTMGFGVSNSHWYTYQWNPTTFLNSPNSQSTSLAPTSNQSYRLTLTHSSGCSFTTQPINITVTNPPSLSDLTFDHIGSAGGSQITISPVVDNLSSVANQNAFQIVSQLEDVSTGTIYPIMTLNEIAGGVPGNANNIWYATWISLNTVPEGCYYARAIVDVNNTEPESNEVNNMAYAMNNGSRRQFCAYADLLVSNGYVNQSNQNVGQGQYVYAMLDNIGKRDALVNFDVSVYLSTDNIWDMTDVPVGSITKMAPYIVGNIAHLDSVYCSIPAGTTPGNYYYIMRVDHLDVVNELVNNNNQVEIPVTVNACPLPVANINATTLTPCVADPVTLWGDFCSGCTYSWNMGDGTTVSNQVTVVQPFDPGVYTLTMNVTNGCGTSTATATVTTAANPNPNWLLPVDTICQSPGNSVFQVSSVAGETHAWNFGDGSSATGSVATHSYANGGTYVVSLTADDGYCDTTINRVIYVVPTIVLLGAVTDESVQGQNDGSIDLTVTGGLAPYSYAWSNSATTEDLSSLSAGTYTVTVTDNAGCTSSASFTVNTGTAGPPPLQIETRTLTSISDTWTTINLQKTFVSPIPILTAFRSSSTTKSVSMRTRVISGNEIQVMVQSTDGNSSGNFTLNLAVFEEGVYNFQDHGVKMEVGKVISAVTAYNGNWSRESRTFQQSYTQPIILGQVMTYNDSKWSQFWPSASNTKNDPPSGTSAALGKHVGEDPNTTRANETIGYVVFEAGSGSINGLPFIAGIGPDIVKGVGNAGPTGYTYTIQGISSSDFAMISPAGMDGGNGGWPVIFGPNPIGTNYLNLAFNEDQSKDSEENHTDEQVFFVVFISSQGNQCNIPINLATTNITTTSCTVSWASVSGASSYELEFQLDGALSWQTVTNITTPSYILSGLTPNSPYKVRVNAQCNNSASNWSSETTFTTTCPTIQPNTSAVDATCFDVLDGTATTNPIGGQVPYTYDWGAYGNTAAIQNLGPGTYTVIVTDANGCTGTEQVTVSEPQVLSISGQTTPESAANVLDGAIDITVSGGVAPYTFNWGVNGSTEDLTGLEGGQYIVQVTDANGCVETATFTVSTSQGITPPKMEIGTLQNSGQYWQTVNFQNTYQSPIILVSPILPSGQALPVVARVKDVTSTGCKLSLQNPSGDTLTVPYSMYYWIIEEGTYTVALHGIKMEAKKFLSTTTSRKGAWVQSALSYQNAYTNPVVLAQVMSFNDPDFSVAWSSSSSRTSPATPNSFSIGKHIGEDTDHARADETIGYVVIEAGSGMIGNVAFEANVGADIVRGPGNNLAGYDYPIVQVETTLVAITTVAGIDGGDGCWPVPLGPYPLGSDLTLLCDEDQIADSERKHTTENVGYIVFGVRLNTNTRLAGPAPSDSKKEESIHSLIIFPNPVSGPTNFVSLSLQSVVEDNALIEVFDVRGKRVLMLDSWVVEVGENTFKMNIEELQEGLSIVRVRVGNSSIARKMVVKR